VADNQRAWIRHVREGRVGRNVISRRSSPGSIKAAEDADAYWDDTRRPVSSRERRCQLSTVIAATAGKLDHHNHSRRQAGIRSTERRWQSVRNLTGHQRGWSRYEREECPQRDEEWPPRRAAAGGDGDRHRDHRCSADCRSGLMASLIMKGTAKCRYGSDRHGGGTRAGNDTAFSGEGCFQCGRTSM